MKSKLNNSTKCKSYLAAGVLSLAAILSTTACTTQQTVAAASIPKAATFNTPAEAGQALLAAAQSNDQSKLEQVLGVKTAAIVNSGDPVEDKQAMASFVRKYDQMNRWVPMTDGSQVLYIGADNYEFPIPVAKDSSGKWQFDSTAGEEEVMARNIGRNELLAMDAVSAIANAEEIYYQSSHDGNPAHQYTQLIISNPGKQDGLYWNVPAGQPASPLARVNDFFNGPLTALAPGDSQVFDGYSFRILTAQGDEASDGAKNYIVNGQLKKGFAIIASPVKYRESGIMTFILNREGVLYQRDLGAGTTEIAGAIRAYNPSDKWMAAE